MVYLPLPGTWKSHVFAYLQLGMTVSKEGWVAMSFSETMYLAAFSFISDVEKKKTFGAWVLKEYDENSACKARMGV